jgi:hypothetical protein
MKLSLPPKLVEKLVRESQLFGLYIKFSFSVMHLMPYSVENWGFAEDNSNDTKHLQS